MKLKVIRYIKIISLHIILINLLFGQSTIDGLTIQQTVRWSGNITVQGDVLIAPSGILIIEPGTTINFVPNTDKLKSGQDKTRSEIIVQGVLIANGTAARKIAFTSSNHEPKMGDWYGINIASARQGSELNYTIIEYAYNGLTIKKSSPKISNSQIRYNFYSGLTIEIKSNPDLQGNIISENGYAGVVCRLGSNPVLSDNIITLNQIGIIAFGNSSPNLGSLTQGTGYNIGRNTIVDNQEYNIHNHSSQEIKAENNTWGSTNQKAIAGTIYDASDEAKYGAVDVNPVFRSRENLERRFLGNQFSSTIADNTTQSRSLRTSENQSNSGAKTPLSSQNSHLQQPFKTNPVASLDTTNISQIQKHEEVSPLLASNNVKNPVSSEVEEVAEESQNAQIDYDQTFLDVFLDSQNEILHRETPQIRNKELGLGAKGNVIVRVLVDKVGLVESANVVKSLNYYYDDLSLESAKKFKFKPGTINNHPVQFSTILVFKY